MTDAEERAREIVDRGGQILLPYEAGDAEVRWPSRRTLVAEITQAIREAPAKERNERQAAVSHWCGMAFGAEHARSLPQRGVRLLEEALEAYQATGARPEMAHKLVDFVFSRPKGKLGQELGGIGVTLLALAQAAGLSAEEEEVREVTRVLSVPLRHFAKRNEAKNAAGFNVSDDQAIAEKREEEGDL